jgi:hypothetical protein
MTPVEPRSSVGVVDVADRADKQMKRRRRRITAVGPKARDHAVSSRGRQMSEQSDHQESTSERSCPRLGLRNDPASRCLEPTAEHRCYAARSPRRIGRDHQLTYCLTPEFAACPAFAAQQGRARTVPFRRLMLGPVRRATALASALSRRWLDRPSQPAQSAVTSEAPPTRANTPSAGDAGSAPPATDAERPIDTTGAPGAGQDYGEGVPESGRDAGAYAREGCADQCGASRANAERNTEGSPEPTVEEPVAYSLSEPASLSHARASCDPDVREQIRQLLVEARRNGQL